MTWCVQMCVCVTKCTRLLPQQFYQITSHDCCIIIDRFDKGTLHYYPCVCIYYITAAAKGVMNKIYIESFLVGMRQGCCALLTLFYRQRRGGNATRAALKGRLGRWPPSLACMGSAMIRDQLAPVSPRGKEQDHAMTRTCVRNIVKCACAFFYLQINEYSCVQCSQCVKKNIFSFLSHPQINFVVF